MTLPLPLQQALDTLEHNRAGFLQAITGLTPEQASHKPDHDSWSAADIVEHVLLAEAFTVDLTHSLVGASTGGFPADLEAFAPLPPPIGMEAPPPIQPRGTPSLEELTALLANTSARSLAALERLSRVDPRQFVAPHPLFGPLDLGQWWVLNGTHYQMHLAQARDTLASHTS